MKYDLEQVEIAIQQRISDIDQAWNQRNAQAFAQLFQEEADFQFHSGLMLCGCNDEWLFAMVRLFRYE